MRKGFFREKGIGNRDKGEFITEKIFCLKPRYVDAFKCDGARCGALCCRNAWNIYVDAKTYEKYSALPGVTQHLRQAGEHWQIAPNEKNCCPFLDADNLCRIQKAHGENFLSRVCASYPRIVTRFENFLEVALSPTCPLAAELILLADAPLAFEVAEADEKILRLGANNILKGLPRNLTPLIFDVQLAMIAILQERRLTLDGRLVVLGFFLDRVEELLYGDRLDDATLRRLAVLYSSEKFFREQVPLMLASVRFDATRKTLPANFATVAENFLVNEIILGAWPFRLDAAIAKNFGAFLAVYKMFERRAQADDPLSAARDVSRQIDHGDELSRLAATLGDGDTLTLLEKFLTREA